MERARSPAATHTCFLNLSTLGGASRNFPEGTQGRGRQGWNPRLNPEPSQGSDVLPTGPSHSTQTLWSHLQHPPHAGTYQSSRSAKITAGQPQEQAQPGATASILSPHSPGPGGRSPPAVGPVGRVGECGQLPREIGGSLMPAVPLGASGQGAAGPRLHGRARPAYHRHVTDTERPDNWSSSEPGTQKRPTMAAAAPAWAHSRSGNTRFRSLL